MPLYKNDRGWYGQVNYKDVFGQYRTKSTKIYETKREASDAERELYTKVRNGECAASNITFAMAYKEFCEWKKDNVKTSTCITYPSMWNHCKSIANMKINDLTVPQYRAFKEELTQKGLSVPRKNKIHKFVRQLVNYARSMYDVDCNVVDRVGGFKEPDRIRTRNVDFYTFDEFQKFIKCVHDPIYHALFTTLYYQGCRIGEANALTWNDIDFVNNTISINKTANTKIKGVPYMVTSTKKSASDRILPLDEDVKKELFDLHEKAKKYKNYEKDWFVFGCARPLAESWIHNVKNNAAKEAGVKTIRIHDFRHSCASFLINLGCQPMVVQRYLGHASLKITMDTYSHMYPNQLTEASKLISEFKSSLN